MADSSSSKTTKRRVRPAAPTVRQQAEKAQANTDKPARSRHLRAAAQTSGKPFRRIGRLFNRQPFRFIGRIIFPSFLRNALGELRLVQWPSRKETRQLTFAVLAFAVAFGVVITIVDYGLDKLFKAVLLK